MQRSRNASVALTAAVLGFALLAAFSCCPSLDFVQPSRSTSTAAAIAAGVAAPAVVGSLPAFAGEPPSVGEHWYWDLGFGSLHGETASIIFLVFFLLVIISVLGFGGSSKRAA
eukprot:TRINITY_DN3021_c0_g1_i2.p2 TRINITY_DN3021_c0_g1~~TRINITY_DN3021_c0_g1_i2.p2  ORF type:complete len:113 (+),score=34.02 TRINITY_DN3021_c0_g1_i2:74-412(+)